MKKLYILMILFLISFNLLSQSVENNMDWIYFSHHIQKSTDNKQVYPPGWVEPDWWTGQLPGGTMAVYTNWGKVSITDTETGKEYPLKIGDWVGTFCVGLDGELQCCGANQFVDENQNLGINMIADDPQTKEKEGFYENEKIILKIYRWDVYDELDGDFISYKCYPNNPLYDCDGFFNNGKLYVVDTLIVEESLTRQDIVLQSGWDVISSYIKPIDKRTDSMFVDIYDNMIILKNLYGMVYWNLGNGTNINTLPNWWIDHGFSIKMSSRDTLSIYGLPIESIDLSYDNQWVIIPVPYNNTYLVEEVFPTMYTQETGIVKYKEFVYWPYYGINTLQYIEAGCGYMTHVEDYTEPIFESSNKKILNRLNSDKWVVNVTDNTNIILIENIDNILKYGETIAVFDDYDNCFGYSIYNGGENMAIIAFGDDLNTKIKDGFYNDEEIKFKILDINNDLIDFEPYLREHCFTGNNKIIYGKVISSDVFINYIKPDIKIIRNSDNIIILNDKNILYRLYDLSGRLIEEKNTNKNIKIKSGRFYILNIYDNYNNYNYKIY